LSAGGLAATALNVAWGLLGTSRCGPGRGLWGARVRPGPPARSGWPNPHEPPGRPRFKNAANPRCVPVLIVAMPRLASTHRTVRCRRLRELFDGPRRREAAGRHLGPVILQSSMPPARDLLIRYDTNAAHAPIMKSASVSSTFAAGTSSSECLMPLASLVNPYKLPKPAFIAP
jgi:hypothetical protein